MLRRFRLVCAATALLLIGALAGCSAGGGPAPSGPGSEPAPAPAPAVETPGVTATEILIGIHTPLTGPIALSGTSEKDGLEIWADEVNKAGGINGRKVRIIAYDDQGSPQQALNYVRRLLNQDKVFALLAGSASGSQLPVMDVVRESGVPFIVSLSTNPKVVRPGDKNIYRVFANDDATGAGVVDYLVEKLKVKRPAIIYNTNDYGLGGLAATQNELKKFNLDFVAKESYNVGETDLSAQLLRIKRAEPDAVIAYSLHPEAAIIVRQGRELGLNVPFIGGGATATPLFPQTAGQSGVGFVTAYFLPHLPDDTGKPAIKQYLDALNAKYAGKLPAGRPTFYDLLAYSSGKLLESALREAGKDITREKVLAALDKVQNFDAGGILFPISFTPQEHEGGTRVSFLEVTPEVKFKVLDYYLTTRR